MFSWLESLSSLGVGSSGCGKLLSLTWKNVVGVGFCTRSWPEEASGVVEHGGMGSGFIFSLFPKGSSARVEAFDICVEMRVGGRVERGWRLEKHSKALFMCELSSGFKLWNSAISCHEAMACGLTQLELTVVLDIERGTIC